MINQVTKQLIALRRKKILKNKKKLPLAPRPMFPKRIEKEYQKELLKYISRVQELISQRLIEALPLITKQAYADRPGARLDAWYDDINEIVDGIGIQIDREYTDRELEELARRKGISISDFQKQQQGRQLRSVLGIDVIQREPWLADKINSFAIQNVNLIQSMKEKLLDEVKNITMQGTQEGLRVEEIASQIQERFGVSESKAEFIARDQTAKLNSNIEQARQQDLGVQEYVWSTSLDERVRPSHAAKEGKTFRWDDPPADTGHPGEDYNCVPGNTLINGINFANIAYRRNFTGKLIEIVTEKGNLFATSNHPVFTNQGWISAKRITQSHKLFMNNGQLFNCGELNEHNSDSTASQIFNALLLLFPKESRRASSEMQFHGDSIVNQEINIIRPDWSLMQNVDSAFLKQCQEFLFAMPDFSSHFSSTLNQCFSVLGFSSNACIRRLCEFLTLFEGSKFHSIEHRLAAISWLDTISQQTASNGVPLDFILRCKKLFTGTVNVFSDDFFRRIVFSIMGSSISDSPIVGFDSINAEFLGKIVGTNIEVRGNPNHGFAVLQTPVNVINVLSSDVNDFQVYNFQTNWNWYLANNLIIHNCRCVALPKYDDILNEA